MPMTMRVLCAAAALFAGAWVGGAAEPPAPYGPVPNERQLAWHESEFYGFLHFTVNTFTDKEWGYGDEAESVFAPTDFDAEQIVGAARDAGMKGLILTCKHHDGFCLWPSKYTEHSVKNSTWMNGKGDVVRAIADACKKNGLWFGTYLSPWDRNHKDYARPEYIEYYRNQLRELMTEYGPIHEVWFDGANGGDGFYGGARERRNIDRKTYYDWENTRKIVYENQPLACMFSDGGPEVRWVGNERGTAGDPCWATLNRDDFAPGIADTGRLNRGDRPGTHWLPAECDVSIRPGWFYHASEDGRVRSPQNLVDLYYQSVGRGASFLLNLPPDRRGRIHENDVKSLLGFRKIIDATFAKDLAQGAKASAGNVRGGDPKFGAAKVLDGRRDTYWCTDDSVAAPELVLDLGRETVFNVVSLREFLPLGQRVDDWALDHWDGQGWTEFAKGSAIGSRRLWRGDDVTTSKVRLRITKAAACPAISEFALYLEPEWARAAGGAGKVDLGMRKTGWKVVSSSYETPGSGVARNAIDGDPGTLWHTHGPDGEHAAPQEIVIDLGKTVEISAFLYLPRSDSTRRGTVDRYAFYAGDDGRTWGKPAAEGEFANILANPIQQVVKLEKPVKARFIRFVALHSAEANHVTVAEIGVVGK
jgi:alpha-L-fucosidase